MKSTPKPTNFCPARHTTFWSKETQPTRENGEASLMDMRPAHKKYGAARTHDFSWGKLSLLQVIRPLYFSSLFKDNAPLLREAPSKKNVDGSFNNFTLLWKTSLHTRNAIPNRILTEIWARSLMAMKCNEEIWLITFERLARVYRCNTETSAQEGFPKTLENSPNLFSQLTMTRMRGNPPFFPFMFTWAFFLLLYYLNEIKVTLVGFWLYNFKVIFLISLAPLSPFSTFTL
jgi:hypothetical protein